MDLKFNKSTYINNITIFFIIIGLFLSENLWNLKLVEEQVILDQFYVKFVAIASLLLSFIYFLIRKINGKKSKLEYSKIWFLLYLSLILSYLFGGVYIFNQPAKDLYKGLFWFGGVFIYYILSTKYSNNFSAQKVFSGIIIYGIIASLTAIFTALLNIDFFHGNRIQDFRRFGFVRVSGFAENAIIFSFLYFYIMILKYKSKKIFNLFIIFPLFTIFFVFLSRQFIGTVLLIMLLFLINNKKYIHIFIILLFFLTFIPFLFNDYINQLFTSFNPNNYSLEADSINTRLGGIAYYFLLSIKTFGTGFGWISISPLMLQNDPFYIGTYIYNFFLIDLGVFQVIFQFGLLGLFVLILFVFKTIRLTKIKTTVQQETIYYFILLKAFSLSYFFYWPLFTFFFALIAYLSETFFKYDAS